MSNASSSRNKWMTPAPKAPLTLVAEFLRRADVWARIGLCALTAAILFVVMFGWEPPFPCRVRQAPLRDLHAHTSFQYDDFKATDDERDRKRRNFMCFYSNDPQPLEQLRQGLVNDIFKVKLKDFAEVQETDVWSKFFPVGANDDPETAADEESFNLFREAITADDKLEVLGDAVAAAFSEIEEDGVLGGLGHDVGEGNMDEIEVYLKGNFENRHRTKVEDVRIAEVAELLHKRLIEEFAKQTETFPHGKLVPIDFSFGLNRKSPRR